MADRDAWQRYERFEYGKDWDLPVKSSRGRRRENNVATWAAQPVRDKDHGNLLGLALIAGLFAFFLADGLPSGLNPIVAFLIAAAVVLALFFGGAVMLLVIERRRPRAADRSAIGGPRTQWTSAESWTATSQRNMWRWLSSDELPDEIREKFEELLAAVDELPSAGDRKTFRAVLLAFVSAGTGDSRVYAWSAVQAVGRLAGLEPQLDWLREWPEAAPQPWYDEMLDILRRKLSRG
ncbi:hypothetical protein [Kribbella speibonae]|uniref:DUF4129 domain-containing protein n=1 Tax=Kribbella speibonae TaxID=1572660 RepID=A0ABY2ADE9_9ACTN|nr:hypothetical protein [Kribbella speibonae]TCC26641.1 hypothetical protein E0H58_00980 [Kribbella speibonae]